MCASADNTCKIKRLQMKKINQFLETGKEYSLLFLRLIISWRLIAGTWPYISSIKHISEVRDYFAALHLPLPSFSAYVSVYLQFICAILLTLGLWFRAAAVVMIINFTVAIIAAHLNDTIENSFSAWIILATSFFFLFNGAGNKSLDYKLRN